MIQTLKGHLYTGITTDVQRRFAQHASKKGAKYFFMDPPDKVVWTCSCVSKSEALQKEAAIKKLEAHEKRQLFIP